MIEDIYEPLIRYRDEFKQKFAQIAEKTFEKLSADSKVDIEENRKTVFMMNSVEQEKSELENKRALLSFLRFVLIAAVICSAGFCVYKLFLSEDGFDKNHILAATVVFAVSLPLAFWVSPKIKQLDAKITELRSKAAQLKRTAWEQMAPLNKLFTWDLLPRMMSECVPKLEFDPFFCCGRIDELRNSFGWNDSFNSDISILFAHSGSINGNPFAVCKFRRQVWGTAVYTGTKVISYTELVRDSNGKLRRETRYQTLVATVEKPKPEYVDQSAVIYGNDAAADLSFSREPSEYSGKDGFFSNLGKKGELKKLEKFARNLEDDSDFTMMSNKEFEVLFHADDRDDEVQFRILFTPLAQQQMVKLLNDKEHGYGDDFSFIKQQKINLVHAEHLDATDIDTDPKQFRNYSYDLMKEFFITRTNDYFKAVYFAFAPLLTIPLYQQTRSFQDIYGSFDTKNVSFWETESFVNYIGGKKFAHPESKTTNILKATDCHLENGGTVYVTAHGFKTVERLELVPVFGNDNRWHNVPVEWLEYIPVRRTNEISIGVTDRDNAAQDTEKIRRQLYIRR